MLEELLDKEAQQQLEGGGGEPPALNWSLEITERLGSRLHALWNRSAGDCLLDSAMQATWGVFDRDNALRRALADTLQQAGQFFYPRWREYEASQASRMLDFTLEETQWQEDWESLLATAAQPGSALEQLHVFALAHILRRPIIVYGVKYVKSFRGEDIGYARFEGVYLPLLWEPSFCIRSPIALGYTRGHFTALVPIEPYASSRIPPLATHGVVSGNNSPLEQLQIQMQTTFMPLMDREHKLLPIHFLTTDEIGREESIYKEWLDVCRTEGGILVAQQKLHKRPLLVAQMLEEWLNHYRRLAQTNEAPFSRPPTLQDYSSDGDTEDE
ncbi:PREDICTED: ubiquitin thioesterase trabid-like [Atta colombica]|uniref:ubiquitin thioesterase trabid-like n=3 Tax=Myrmicinae TaxID=34695 RepID=UPI00084CD020|nr:PREDICTED: ubiquitin thioesterase trabid-like [Atta colombica]